MRLSDLRDKKVRTLDGELLGRVHEVHCDGGRVTALMCGAGSLIERLIDRRAGRRIAWECVRRINDREIVVTTDPPKKASGSRSRRRTRPANGPQSRR